jgi:hypothetical protein
VSKHKLDYLSNENRLAWGVHRSERTVRQQSNFWKHFLIISQRRKHRTDHILKLKIVTTNKVSFHKHGSDPLHSLILLNTYLVFISSKPLTRIGNLLKIPCMKLNQKLLGVIWKSHVIKCRVFEPNQSLYLAPTTS